jgi:hypothetical protein
MRGNPPCVPFGRACIRGELKRIGVNLPLGAVVCCCQFSPQWSQFVFGVKEPLNFRRNGASVFSA